MYYASQDVALAEFALSLDGGRTYGPAVPMYHIQQCAGLHGHIKVSPVSGAAFVPVGNCTPFISGGIFGTPTGQQGVAVSSDGGVTWNVFRIPGSKASTWDPSVGVSTGGVVYFGYGDNGDRIPRVAVSRDEGRTWTVGPDLGAPWGIKRIAFPAMVAGDDNRAAFAFLGTRYDGEALGSGARFEGTWELHISTTYDGGANWVTVNATGDDPVQRGNICDAGISCPGSPDTRNLLDFMDVQIDAQGRILAAYADGCVSALLAAPAGSSAAPVCELLQAEEITAVQGATVKERKASEQSVKGLQFAQCFYATDDFVRSISVTLITGDTPATKASASRKYWDETFNQ